MQFRSTNKSEGSTPISALVDAWDNANLWQRIVMRGFGLGMITYAVLQDHFLHLPPTHQHTNAEMWFRGGVLVAGLGMAATKFTLGFLRALPIPNSWHRVGESPPAKDNDGPGEVA